MSGNKRSISELEDTGRDRNDGDDSSSDSDLGPALPPEASTQARKKRRTLRHESLFLAALPNSTRYNKSLMHRDVLAFTTVTPYTDFIITASIDSQVSFWKKNPEDVEFVKQFKAHNGEIKGVSASWDGRNFASSGGDKSVKIWDVQSFDLTAVIHLDKQPGCICWVYGKHSGGGVPLLAVGNEENGEIAIYDGRGEQESPIHVIKGLHRKPVVALAYNNEYDCAVSADAGGMIEYWQPGQGYSKPNSVFNMKSETNLFEFKKAKSVPSSITFSPSGSQFVTFSLPDRRVRVFDFVTGKLKRTYDESIDTVQEMQQAGTAVVKLADVDFGRKVGIERDIDNTYLEKGLGRYHRINVIFDESGNFLLYGSLYGIKIINLVTNKVMRVYGKEENFRPVHVSLYQGQPSKKGITTVEMAASENPLLREAEIRDAMIIATGLNKVRFFIFTNEETINKSERDVQNEKPRTLNASQHSAAPVKKEPELGTAAVLHTTLGDIVLRLYPQAAPKAVENFLGHAKSGYYSNVIFHRIIRKFMIQTGDPLGDGTGGESIWGKDFEDEFSSLKHDRPYTLSMANAGPGTNASQFFITTERTPWLDGKHTIFGRAVKGMDVIHRIENVKTYKEKPEEDVKIVSISLPEAEAAM